MINAIITVLIYFGVLCVLILSVGFVVVKFNYDKTKTDDLVYFVIAIAVWPFLMFAVPVFYALRFIYKVGARIASKI